MNELCDIYLNSDLTKKDLILLISEHLYGEVERNTISNNNLELYVEENDEFDKDLLKNSKNGFIYYPYILEIEFYCSRELQISITSKLLLFLRKRKYSAIPSCNFEDSLPQ